MKPIPADAFLDVLKRLNNCHWPLGKRRRKFVVTAHDNGVRVITVGRGGAWVTCSIYVPGELTSKRKAKAAKP